MRTRPQRLRLFAFFALLFMTAPALAQSAAAGSNGADFDLYVFTLSWSPGFCDLGGAAKSPDQCASGSGLGFVVHGLWPDSRYSTDPEDCDDVAVSSRALQMTVGVYPNRGLARYEYEKHGTCTGLSPEAYFSMVKDMRDQIVIPDLFKAPQSAANVSSDGIVRAFMASNPNMQANNIVVTCVRGELTDVRICVGKDLHAYAVCPPKVLSHSCRSAQLTVAPLR